MAVFGGVMMSVVLGIGAFGVDVGRTFTDRRKVQSAADLAAIAAASRHCQRAQQPRPAPRSPATSFCPRMRSAMS